MEQNLAVMLGVAVPVFWAWGYALAALYWFVRPALRTGVLQARGRTYDRSGQPVRFWLGIVFWITMAALLAFPVAVVVLQLWRAVVG
jgi:hypothetical protein